MRLREGFSLAAALNYAQGAAEGAGLNIFSALLLLAAETTAVQALALRQVAVAIGLSGVYRPGEQSILSHEAAHLLPGCRVVIA